MARARKLDSLQAYRRALKQGYGLGSGINYAPWLTVHDVPTRGTAAIIRGIKAKRDHHCLSQQEKYFFYLAEFSPSVVDIREQFPLLPLDLMCQLAQTLRIKYPEVPCKKVPNVQSTDFLLTSQRPAGSQETYLAVSVKTAEELDRPRVLEKLELERVWWQLLGVPFQLFVCTEALKQQALDIEWLTQNIRFDGTPDASQLNAACAVIDDGTYPIGALVDLIKGELSIEGKEALKILKCLVVERFVKIDWSCSIRDTQQLTVTSGGWGQISHGAECK